MNTLLVDVGHGGKDSRAVGIDNLLEKNVNLYFGTLLGDALQRYDPTLRISFTRQDDSSLSLKRRVEIEHEVAPNLFVSVHCNSSAQQNTGSGFEVYYLSDNGKLVATNVLQAVKDGNFKIHGDGCFFNTFYVLKHTHAIAILLELFFLNNQEDCKILKNRV